MCNETTTTAPWLWISLAAISLRMMTPILSNLSPPRQYSNELEQCLGVNLQQRSETPTNVEPGFGYALSP
ncbi:unnamed protein product [Cochlearia groenlandica]